MYNGIKWRSWLSTYLDRVRYNIVGNWTTSTTFINIDAYTSLQNLLYRIYIHPANYSVDTYATSQTIIIALDRVEFRSALSTFSTNNLAHRARPYTRKKKVGKKINKSDEEEINTLESSRFARSKKKKERKKEKKGRREIGGSSKKELEPSFIRLANLWRRESGTCALGEIGGEIYRCINIDIGAQMTVYVGALAPRFGSTRRWIRILSGIRMHRGVVVDDDDDDDEWLRRDSPPPLPPPPLSPLRPCDRAQLPCNRDSRTAIIIALALSSAATSIYNARLGRCWPPSTDGWKEKGANRNNSPAGWTRVSVESSAARHGKIRSIKDHIVPWFYNQRSDLVTRLRLEPVNLERIFFSCQRRGGG